MMAVILIRIMVAVACLLLAVTVCPAMYLLGDKTGAIGTLIMLYLVGSAATPSKEDQEAYGRFQQQRAAR